MSEFDSLSDSDWLEVMSSGHESDGAFSHESDHDDLSSRGLSRRSSFSNAAGEVDAWEGMLSDVGTDAEADTAASGTYPSSLPLVAQSAQPFAGPHGDDDDERVREALDQSFVGTLSGSRTMATSAVSSATSSTHSVHDLKLSFPDPLSSPRDELNRSYEAILPEDTKLPLIPESDSEQQPHDPGQTLPTPVVQAHSAELEIYLYGSSHPLKWTFVQDLVHKAASFAGYRLTNGLLTDDEAYSQALYFAKENDSHLDFFDLVTVHDKTNGKDKFELNALDSPSCPSLAIVYLPTARLPILSWHTSYLPVLIPSDAESANPMLLQAAEDDWELLAVPRHKVTRLAGRASPIFDTNQLSALYGRRAYGLLSHLSDEVDEPLSKPLTEQLKSAKSVKLFALMSIIMGFAMHTAFPPTPSNPTPATAVQSPSPANSHLWGIVAPQNHSIVHSSTSASAAPTPLHAHPHANHVLPASGGFAVNGETSGAGTPGLRGSPLPVYSTGSSATALSVTAPESAKGLYAAPSPSKALTEVPAGIAAALFKACPWVDKGEASASSSPTAVTSTDVAVRVAAPTAVASMQPKSPLKQPVTLSATAHNVVKLSTATVVQTEASTSTAKPPSKASQPDPHPPAFAEAFEAGTKVLTDISDLLEAADGLIASVLSQTEQVISQSKGKAKVLNERVAYRNGRAKRRAREWKKKGEKVLSEAKGTFKGRTERAKRRARELSKRGEEVWAGVMGSLSADESCAWAEKPGTKRKTREPREDKENRASKRACFDSDKARRADPPPQAAAEEHGLFWQFAF